MAPTNTGSLMSTIFMSSKGGNCTTVTAAAYAYLSAIRGNNVLLIDLCGDIPAVIGAAQPTTPGINDWLSEGCTLNAEQLVQLGDPVMQGLVVVHTGSSVVDGEPRWKELADAIHSLPHTVIFDAGTGFIPEVLRNAVSEITMVTRSCYLSLRHATTLQRPTNAFLIEESGRALTASDVSHVLGVPIMAKIPYDSTISRAVDAGLLPSRVEQLFAPHFTNL